MIKKITLKSIVNCTLEQQMRIREIRNQPNIREAMYTSHEIKLEEHLEWINKVQKDKNQIVYIVLNDLEKPVGMVSITSLDLLHKKTDWAFYLDQEERGGLGSALEYNLIEYVFNILMLEKLNCEVIETNAVVVKLHEKFCFIKEGFRRANIEKNGKRLGVYFLGLTKNDWLKNKERIYHKYQAVISKFDITF